MFKIIATHKKPLHRIFQDKLAQYEFHEEGENRYVCDNRVDDLAGVMFYKKNFETGLSPLRIEGKRTKRRV